MKSISDLAKKLSATHLAKAAKPGDTFYWSPQEQTVYYNPTNNSVEGQWALLHESGHALLNHIVYFNDIELVKMELEAWEQAKLIGDEVGIRINEEHIQDCIDSYRNWLHRRSLCPDCNLSGVQLSQTVYSCVFCHAKWTVTAERFCRPYRRTIS